MTVDSRLETAVRNGASFPVDSLDSPDALVSRDSALVRLLDGSGDLLGIYRIDGAVARAEVVTA